MLTSESKEITKRQRTTSARTEAEKMDGMNSGKNTGEWR